MFKLGNGVIFKHKNRLMHSICTCISCSPLDAFDPDLKHYPKFGWAQYLETELLPGEMLIIPTGWFHQVRALLEDLICSWIICLCFNMDFYPIVFQILLSFILINNPHSIIDCKQTIVIIIMYLENLIEKPLI